VTELLYANERLGSGATLRLDSGEVCLLSVARSGVIVRTYRGRFGRMMVSFFGSTLYEERNASKAAAVGWMLFERYPKAIPLTLRNPVFSAFLNAIWHCPDAVQVGIALNEASESLGSIAGRRAADREPATSSVGFQTETLPGVEDGSRRRTVLSLAGRIRALGDLPWTR
jgi:hypothetical protein